MTPPGRVAHGSGLPGLRRPIGGLQLPHVSTIWRWLLQPARDLPGQSPGLTDKLAIADITFDRLFQQHEPQIFGYLYRMTGDRQLASDLSQETFLRAWQHFDKVSAYREPVGWLFRVATNLALNARRDRLRLLLTTSSLGDDEEPEGADATSTVAESALVHDILQGLTPRARAGLVLREVYGMSLEEVAEMLEMSPVATKKMLSRAREQFRARYLQEGA